MTSRRSDGQRVWAIAALVALVISSLWLAIAPAGNGSALVLATAGGSPHWLIGVFRFAGSGAITGTGYYLVLLAASAFWASVVWMASTIGSRTLLWVSGGLIAVFLLAPPLLSQDVFSYIAYARLGVVHHLNPYAYRPFDIPGDPVFGYAGSKDASDVYGPFFTLLTYPLAWLSVPAAFWVLKVVAAASTFGLVVLTRSIAGRVGAERSRAVALIGLAPATLVHVVGGAHNEALTMLILMAGVALALSRSDGSREAAGGFVGALAVGVKASAAVPLVFMLAAAREKAKMFGAMVAAGVLALIAGFAGFGSHALDGLNLLSSNQNRSSSWSLPHRSVDLLADVFGNIDRHAATNAVRLVFVLILAAVVVYLLIRSWKRPETWLANAGWATLGVLLASAWLVPWYLLWLFPFAAVSRSRNLQIATMIFATYALVIAIPF